MPWPPHLLLQYGWWYSEKHKHPSTPTQFSPTADTPTNSKYDIDLNTSTAHDPCLGQQYLWNSLICIGEVNKVVTERARYGRPPHS